jgi:hypothetical protein
MCPILKKFKDSAAQANQMATWGRGTILLLLNDNLFLLNFRSYNDHSFELI